MRRRRKRADWVYRAEMSEFRSIGTYVAEAQAAVGKYTIQRNDPILGTFNSSAFVLIDSIAYMELMTVESSAGGGIGLPAAARPDLQRGRKAVMVEGDLLMQLLGAAVGTTFKWAWRLGWFEQDTITGLVSLQPEYSMFEPQIGGTTTPQDVVNFANERLSNIREKFYHHHINPASANANDLITERLRVKINRKAPSSKHALMLYVETSSATTINGSVRYFPRLRTLVE